MVKWKIIEGYSDYTISNSGKVVSKRRKVNRTSKYRGDSVIEVKPTVLKLLKNSAGYYTVCLYSNKKPKYLSVHRLVALHFIPNPCNKKFVNHIDGNKLNNSVLNLEWVTPKENSVHANSLGLQEHPKGEDRYNSKLKESDVLRIRELYDNKIKTVAELSDIYKMSKGCIGAIAYRKSWRHI